MMLRKTQFRWRQITLNQSQKKTKENSSLRALLRNSVAGVNASDVNVAAGRYTPGAVPPVDLGFEAAGEVIAVGEGVEHLAVGDFAATSLRGGGFRTHQLV